MKKPNTPTNGPASGLIAWLENTRVVLPLKGLEARFSITGPLAQVEMDQIYFQDNKKPLDVTYTFPLPGGASVYGCALHTNDRVVRAVVKPVDEAREMAAEGRRKGHRTVLVEEVRGNLFELNLGLLMPGDTAIIRLAWFQQVEEEDGLASLRLPFAPGVRYIPGTPLLRRNKGKGGVDDTGESPDASRLTPPRIGSLHPDAAYIAVGGTLENTDCETAGIMSPTHVLKVEQKGSAIGLELAAGGDVPDRDLIIRYRPPQPEGSGAMGWSAADGDDTYALVQFTAPDLPENIPFVPSDVYFLLDRSGSMSGDNWTACSKAFRGFLGAMDARDRVWVTFFESEFRDLAEKPLPPAAILAEPVVKDLENWPTGGGTELWPALEHVLVKTSEFSQRRRKVIVLITDGQVGNEGRITTRMQGYPDVVVHTFGIDRAVNDAFLQELARQQGGVCTLRTPQEDVESAIAGLAKQLGTPAVTGLFFEGGWGSPRPIPTALCGGETVTLVLRHCGPGAGEPRIRGLSASQEALVIEARTTPAPQGEAIPLLWKKQRIDTLLGYEESEDEAVRLSCESGLLCRGTAFVAVDEAERFIGTNAVEHLYQPSMSGDTGRVSCMMEACGSVSPPPPERMRSRSVGRRLQKGMERLFGKDVGPEVEYALCEESLPVFSQPIAASYYDDIQQSRVFPPVGASLIGTRGPSWIEELTALMGGDPVLARAFAEWIDQWMESDPADSAGRRESIWKLVGELREQGTGGAVTVLKAILSRPEFAQSVYHAGAVSALDEWGQSLAAT